MRSIDVHHLGRERVICCWQVDDVLVDPGPESSVETLLDQIGDEQPRAVLLTHIHFDHAGAAGALVRRWPQLEVWVHERGAPHLVDPTRLLASATRLYGDDFERLWGEVVPIPQRNLRVLSGGESIDGWDVAYTPGHASHHVAYRHQDSGWAFVGDVAGVRLPDTSLLLPPTPPPDIDLDAWHASLDAVEAWQPAALAITHFGSYADVAVHLNVMRASLDRWSALAREIDADGYAAALTRSMQASLTSEDAASLAQAMPVADQWAGLNRYWSKREQGGSER